MRELADRVSSSSESSAAGRRETEEAVGGIIEEPTLDSVEPWRAIRDGRGGKWDFGLEPDEDIERCNVYDVSDVLREREREVEKAKVCRSGWPTPTAEVERRFILYYIKHTIHNPQSTILFLLFLLSSSFIDSQRFLPLLDKLIHAGDALVAVTESKPSWGADGVISKYRDQRVIEKA